MTQLDYEIQQLGEDNTPVWQRDERGRVLACGIRILAKHLCLPRESILDALDGGEAPAPLRKWLATPLLVRMNALANTVALAQEADEK